MPASAKALSREQGSPIRGTAVWPQEREGRGGAQERMSEQTEHLSTPHFPTHTLR